MIDSAQQLEATHRLVRLDENDLRVVTLVRTYPAEAPDVWDALTSAERIPRWFLPITGDLRVGGHYQLEGNAGGTIESCEPPHRFVATWEYGGSVSHIDVRVTGVDGGTRVELIHTMTADDHWDQYGPGAVGIGWELAGLGLGLHLASGEAVDPEAFEQWSTSDEGRRYMAASGDGWADAHIAGGAPESEARAQADRTTKAYTGG
jgi:uncharacterized protein YndB with AHSA1/START domain